MAKKETKQNKKENNKNKKSFAKGFKAELKKVVWPTPKQLVNNTIAVLTIVLITAAIVFVLDLVFEAVNKQGIDKIRDVVVSTNETTTEDATTETTETTESDNQTSDDQATQEQPTENTESQENVEANTESAE